MPEGDTLYRTAETLRKALAGRTVTRFDTSLDTVARVDARTPVVGRTVAAVEALGKHLLIVFRKPDTPGDSVKVPDSFGIELLTLDLVLHTHLRMDGTWHIYRPGEKWKKPLFTMRVAIHTDAFVAPCFNAPTVEQ